MNRFLALTTIMILASACASFDEGAQDDIGDYMPDDLPANCMGTTTTGPCETEGIDEDACEGSEDCDPSQICAAPFDGDLGFFECQVACVQTMDEFRWCSDDASCCDADATCSARGFCLVEDGGSSDSGSSGSQTATDTGTGTGTG